MRAGALSERYALRGSGAQFNFKIISITAGDFRSSRRASIRAAAALTRLYTN